MINFRYQIISKIGEGRSQVFKAFDSQNKIFVALKVLSKGRPREEHLKLREEYFTITQLDHPNIIKVYDYGWVLFHDIDDNKYHNISEQDSFLILEYFESFSLDNFWERINEPILLRIIQELCSALHYLHQSNFIYSDLKPENILISYNLDNLQLKIIDFDLVSHPSNTKNPLISGSSFYIAPEVLKKEERSFRSDLFSLGILIYRIIYKSYPYNSWRTIDEIKASLFSPIQFPETSYSSSIKHALKKLLSTKPEDRHTSCLNLLYDLGLKIPINKYSNNILTTYFDRDNLLVEVIECLDKKNSVRPIEVRGKLGTGKSFLLKKIEHDKDNCIFISVRILTSKISFFHVLLNKLLTNIHINQSLSPELKTLIMNQLISQSNLEFEFVYKILALVSNKVTFTILIDDFVELDSVTKENIIKLVPFLISKNIQILFAIDSDNISSIPLFSNSMLFELKALTIEETTQFVNSNLSSFLPIGDILRIINVHSDLRIGSIVQLISRVLNSEFLKFEPLIKTIYLETDSAGEKLLISKETELEQIFHMLNQQAINILELLALINRPLNSLQISDFLKVNHPDLGDNLNLLIRKDVLTYNHYDGCYRISSGSVRLIIKNKIDSQEIFHSRIADWMVKNNVNFDYNEIAVQFENARMYDQSFYYYYQEVIRAISKSAYGFAIEILEHLSSIPLDVNKQIQIKYELSKTYLRIGKTKESNFVLESLLLLPINANLRVDLLIQKGETEIALGLYQEAINILEPLLNSKLPSEKINKIQVALSDAYLYLNDYSKVFLICNSLLKKNDLGLEETGKVHNLLALAFIYRDHNYPDAIINFKSAITLFEKAKKIDRVSGMKINLGSIYAMILDYENAKIVWNEALTLNESVGNLEQEAKLLLNYGVLSYDLCEYETAKDQYSKAKIIFESIGDVNSIGLAFLNLGEVNNALGLFSEAFDCFIKSENIFSEIKSFGELAELLLVSAKFFFSVGDKTALNSAFEKYSELINQDLIPAASQNNAKIFKGLILTAENKLEEATAILKEIVIEFSDLKEREEQSNYYFLLFNLVESLISQGQLHEARNYLEKCVISKSVPQSQILKAEKEFYFGLITFRLQDGDPILYFSNCISILEDYPLNLLSAKSFYISAEYYNQRGNTYKSTKLQEISRAIVEHLANNFDDEEKLNCFLSLKFVTELFSHKIISIPSIVNSSGDNRRL